MEDGLDGHTLPTTTASHAEAQLYSFQVVDFSKWGHPKPLPLSPKYLGKVLIQGSDSGSLIAT